MSSPILESSVSETLNIIGDFWMLRVLGRLAMGVRTWGDLADGLGASSATLATRLRQLTEAKCVEKVATDTNAYRLTPRGLDLFPIIAAMDEWRLTWDNPSGEDRSSWTHACGAALRCRSICRYCNEEIARDAAIFVGSERRPSHATALTSRHFRTTRGLGDFINGEDLVPSRALLVFGDRRASQLMAALSRGVSRFDDLLNFTRLHPAVLSDRLRKLQLMEFAYARLYREAPDRFSYGLLPSAQEVFPITMQMMQWGDRWIFDEEEPPVTVMHAPCGHRMVASLTCVTCGEAVTHDTVTLTAPDIEPLFVTRSGTA